MLELDEEEFVVDNETVGSIGGYEDDGVGMAGNGGEVDQMTMTMMRWGMGRVRF